MKASYEFDQDPRYGWASVDLEGAPDGLVIIHAANGSHGFTYSDGEMTPTCICNAWSDSECACPNVIWDTTQEDTP